MTNFYINSKSLNNKQIQRSSFVLSGITCIFEIWLILLFIPSCNRHKIIKARRKLKKKQNKKNVCFATLIAAANVQNLCK